MNMPLERIYDADKLSTLLARCFTVGETRPEILFEGHARNMRALMGISGTRPNQIAHERRLRLEEKTEKTEKPETKK